MPVPSAATLPQAPSELRSVLAQPLALFPSPVTLPSPEAMVAREACCALDTIQQEMERLPHGTRRLAVQLRLSLAPEWIWSVLTDYDHLDSFIPNLASSRQLWRRGNQVALEQVGTQQFCGLRFSARVQLELNEEPDQGRLAFRMLEGDFRCFQGLWQVGIDDTSTWLLYDLTVQGKPGMPIGLIEQRLKEDLASNLRGVQREAQRRFEAG